MKSSNVVLMRFFSILIVIVFLIENTIGLNSAFAERLSSNSTLHPESSLKHDGFRDLVRLSAGHSAQSIQELHSAIPPEKIARYVKSLTEREIREKGGDAFVDYLYSLLKLSCEINGEDYGGVIKEHGLEREIHRKPVIHTIRSGKKRTSSGVELSIPQIDNLVDKAKRIMGHIIENRPDIVVSWFRNLGLEYRELEDIDISYKDSGQRKDVFLVEVKQSGEIRRLKVALKSQVSEERSLFDEGEYEGLVQLRDTGLVPKVAGSVNIEVTGKGYGSIVVNDSPPTVPLEDWITVEAEEFIEGNTVAEYEDNSKGVNSDIAKKCIEALMEVFFRLNNGRISGDILYGPSDFHSRNIIIEQASNRAILIDFGKKVKYSSLANYLIAVVLYYAGQDGRPLEILYKRWPDIDWDYWLNEARKRLLAVKYSSAIIPVLISDELELRKPSVNKTARAITKFLARKKKAGGLAAVGAKGETPAVPAGQMNGRTHVERVEYGKHTVSTRVSTSSGRLNSSLSAIRELVSRIEGRVIIYDVGIGWDMKEGPVTTKELAEAVKEKANVIGFDNQIPAYVITMNSGTALFDENDKLISIIGNLKGAFSSGIISSKTSETMPRDERDYCEKLAKKLREEAGEKKEYVDKEGRKIVVNPIKAHEAENLKFVRANLFKIDETGTKMQLPKAHIVRIANVLIPHYMQNIKGSFNSALQALLPLVYEDGYVLIGHSEQTAAFPDEDYVVYRKKKGKFVLESYMFSCRDFGFGIGAGNSAISSPAKNVQSGLLDIMTAWPKLKEFDHFFGSGRDQPDYDRKMADYNNKIMEFLAEELSRQGIPSKAMGNMISVKIENPDTAEEGTLKKKLMREIAKSYLAIGVPTEVEIVVRGEVIVLAERLLRDLGDVERFKGLSEDERRKLTVKITGVLERIRKGEEIKEDELKGIVRLPMGWNLDEKFELVVRIAKFVNSVFPNNGDKAKIIAAIELAIIEEIGKGEEGKGLSEGVDLKEMKLLDVAKKIAEKKGIPQGEIRSIFDLFKQGMDILTMDPDLDSGQIDGSYFTLIQEISRLTGISDGKIINIFKKEFGIVNVNITQGEIIEGSKLHEKAMALKRYNDLWDERRALATRVPAAVVLELVPNVVGTATDSSA